MYKSFTMKNFRCFHELTITDMQRVNLIAGMNNTGKTALLEALFLHCGAYNPELALRINILRGIEQISSEPFPWEKTPFDSLFFNFDTSQKVELIGKDYANAQRVLHLRLVHEPEELQKIFQPKTISEKDIIRRETQLSLEVTQALELRFEEPRNKGKNKKGSYYLILSSQGFQLPITPPPPFPASFLAARIRIPSAEDAQRFSNLKREKRDKEVLEALQVIEPRLTELAVLVIKNGAMICGDIGLGKLVPLPILGEGTSRLADLVLAIGNAPNGVILVDEIENGLHHSVLDKVWQVIGQVARQFNTQIFATTHSLECIVAAHKAFSQSESYDFCLYRLDRVDDKIRAVRYDKETIEAAIEMGLEVR